MDIRIVNQNGIIAKKKRLSSHFRSRKSRRQVFVGGGCMIPRCPSALSILCSDSFHKTAILESARNPQASLLSGTKPYFEFEAISRCLTQALELQRALQLPIRSCHRAIFQLLVKRGTLPMETIRFALVRSCRAVTMKLSSERILMTNASAQLLGVKGTSSRNKFLGLQHGTPGSSQSCRLDGLLLGVASRVMSNATKM